MALIKKKFKKWIDYKMELKELVCMGRRWPGM